MRITVVRPSIDTGRSAAVLEEVCFWAAPGTDIDVVTLSHGPVSIESEYDEVLAAPGIVAAAVEAAERGSDAVFVTCFADPGVPAARELTGLPVVGGFEPAILTALSLGERIGIITILPSVVPMIRSLARRYGVDTRLGGIDVVDLPVLELDQEDVLVARLSALAVRQVASGESDVIVLGCTGMLGVARAVRDALLAAGHDVPVVDPTAASVMWLETCVRLGVTPSRTTYPQPAEKQRRLPGA